MQRLIDVGGGPARRLGALLGRGPARSPADRPAPSEPTAAERAFLDAVERARLAYGEAEAMEALAAQARFHAMENGGYLPTGERPCRYILRLARERGDEGILAEVVDELDAMGHAPSP